MEDNKQQQVQDMQQENHQGNLNEKPHVNGSQTNIRVFSKTDIFNNLNTEMSEIHENDLYSHDLAAKLIGNDDKVNASHIHQIVQQAIYPYIERIRQLEEIQQQKDNQITALFYTVKKMDEIIKKIESEQSKQTTAVKTSTTGRKGTTILSSTSGGASASTRSSSTTRNGQINSNSLSQSTVLPQSDRVLNKKPSVPSLLDSKKSGQSMSKSTLHDSTSNRGESARTSKVNTPAAKAGKDSKETIEPKKIIKSDKSKVGSSESDTKSAQQANDTKQKKSETINTNNQNTNETQNNTTNQGEQESKSVKIDNYNTAPPLFIHELNDDSHLIENNSNKNYGSDKEDSQHKNLLNISNHNINEDSMLI